MKTPEEIKKGLELCPKDACGSCAYEPERFCMDELKTDALAYIQQLEVDGARQDAYILRLENELEAVKRERDAAVKDLGQVIYGTDWGIDCEYCKHKDKTVCESCEWEWRGACQDNAEERNDLL